MTPAVSILLLTRDGAATLPALLDALDAQRFAGAVERVAVDSGSRDATRALLAGRVDRLLEIPPAEFGHGRTRNLGVGACRAPIVVLLVQDAAPRGEGWLAALVAPFADPAVAAVTARQVPPPGTPEVVRRQLAAAFQGSEVPRRSEPLDAAAFAALAPAARHARLPVDSVCVALRRSVWEAIPFPDVAIAEDLAWGREVLLAGHALVYAPDAVVVHAHDRGAVYELRRTRLLHRELASRLGWTTLPGAAGLALAVASQIRVHLRASWRSPRGIPRALALAVAWPLGQYLGGRDARRGRPLAAPSRPAERGI